MRRHSKYHATLFFKTERELSQKERRNIQRWIKKQLTVHGSTLKIKVVGEVTSADAYKF